MSDLPSWARVGARVVCVDDAIRGGFGFERWPQKCGTYTIREVIYCPEAGSWQLRLHEIVNPAVDYDLDSSLWEAGFNVARFRPVTDLKSDDEVEARLYHKKGLHQSAPRRKSVEA